jgi:hypothetical protein
MKSRFVPLALAAALMLTSLPARGADDRAARQIQIEQKIRALKYRALMERDIAKIWRARLAKNPKTRLPKGLALRPKPKARADWPAGAIAHSAAERAWYDMQPSREPNAAATSSIGPTNPLAAFGPNKRANNPALDLYSDAAQSETSIAAFGNNVVLTWNDGDGFDRPGPPSYQLMGYGYSTDGGTTWTDGVSFPIPAVYPNWMWSSDPVLVVNESTGEFIFAGLVFQDGAPSYLGFPTNGDSNGVAIVKGTFSGGSVVWGAPVLVVAGNNSTNNFDKEWIAVDPANGNLYCTYTRFSSISGVQIEFTRSTNGGTVWSAPIVLSNPADNGYVQGSRVVVDPNSVVHTMWYVIGPNTVDFYKSRRSATLGASFGVERTAASFYSNFTSGAPGFNRERGVDYSGMAVDRTSGPYRGRVYLIWAEGVDYWTSDLFNAGGAGDISEPEGQAAFGVNDTPGTATTFTVGQTLRGTISDINNDFDFFKFTATQGQTCIFYMDSVSAGLDCAFRLFCSDQVTRLAICSLGRGSENLISWTAPANGTYYLRPAAWPAPSSLPGQHPYRIRTIVHVPTVSERSRDHRDIAVCSSADGLTWPTTGFGAPVRVNDDPGWFDNWLPEVAVTGNSRVFTTWYDWRDSAPSTCGGQSNLYLYRSDNGGAGWSNLGLITDATTDWTNVLSNVAPNQGDYVSLFANYNGVYPAWADGRDGNPNAYALKIDAATPAMASLASSVVASDQVELLWFAPEYENQPASLERRGEGSEWTEIASGVVDGSGRIRFTDSGVSAGQRYVYRLAIGPLGSPTYSREAIIDVPGGPALALGVPRPNPAVRELTLSITLPSAASATLALVDVAGRVVATREVGSLGPGTHPVTLRGESLKPGVYVVALRQGDRTVTRRVSLVQ